MSARIEWNIALFGPDGTEYGREPIGPMVPDGGDLVNAETIKFPPMPQGDGVVTSFAICDADGSVIHADRLRRYVSLYDAASELGPYALRLEAGIFPDADEQYELPPVSPPPPIQKLERDGKIGVVISNGYGGGWSTSYFAEDQDHLRETVCMRADIVQAVLDRDNAKAEELARDACGVDFDGCSDDLVVVWVPKGSIFDIEESDGFESIHIIGSRRYMTA